MIMLVIYSVPARERFSPALNFATVALTDQRILFSVHYFH